MRLFMDSSSDPDCVREFSLKMKTSAEFMMSLFTTATRLALKKPNSSTDEVLVELKILRAALLLAHILPAVKMMIAELMMLIDPSDSDQIVAAAVPNVPDNRSLLAERQALKEMIQGLHDPHKK